MAMVGCRTENPPARQETTDLGIVLEQVVLDRFEGTRRGVSARIERLQVDGSRRMIRASGILIDVMSGTDGPAFHIQAPQGSANLTTGIIRLSGGVQGRSSTEGTLRARSVVWSESDRTLRSEGPVQVGGTELRAWAGKAVGHPDRRVIRMEGPVRLRIQPLVR